MRSGIFLEEENHTVVLRGEFHLLGLSGACFEGLFILEGCIFKSNKLLSHEFCKYLKFIYHAP